MFFKSKELKSGFTLIELLVVIAIIGILSSVVLASLNSARAKGEAARAKSQLVNMRAEAALFYDIGNTFVGVCNHMGHPAGTGLFQNLSGAVCNESASAWAAQADTNPGTWCVDADGASTSAGITGTSCN